MAQLELTEIIEQVFSTIFGDNVILATILISIVPIIEIKGAIPFSMSVSIWGNVALSSTQALLFSLIGSCLIVPILALIYIPIINALKRTRLFKRIAIKIEEKVNRSKNKIENRAGNNSLSEENINQNNKVITNTDVNKKSSNLAENNGSIALGNEENEQTNKTVINEVKENKAENLNHLSMFKRTQPYNKIFFIKLLCVFLFVCVPLPLTGVWTGTCVAVMLGLGFVWSCVAVFLGNIVAGVLVTLVASIPGFDSIYIVYAVLAFVVVLLLVGLIKKLVNKKKQKNS